MSKILAFGATNAKKTMNKKLASFVANKIAPREAILIDLNDYEMPIYSDDRKRDSGIPKKYINDLKKTIRLCGVSARVLTISNGEHSKSFKNYQFILEHLADKNFARDDLIIALGGGVVGDISGIPQVLWGT